MVGVGCRKVPSEPSNWSRVLTHCNSWILFREQDIKSHEGEGTNSGLCCSGSGVIRNNRGSGSSSGVVVIVVV